MPAFTSILRSLPEDKFAEVFSTCTRKAREGVFARHKIRKPRTLSGMPRAGASTEQRTLALHEVLQTSDDEELCEEILRAWLLTKRPMLGAALDHLGIPHEGGLTDSDQVSKFEKLSRREIKELGEKLADATPLSDVIIYLKFMGAEGVDEALGGVARCPAHP